MIDFPSSPVSGQVYTYSGRTWVWDETGWQRQINAGQQVSVFTLVSGLVQNNVDPLPYLISGTWHEITYV
ncbi:MAG TPA: hypothetical protein PK020_19515 [Ilumatobacteraceae bacterium]|nr:hypothetical protein [Ilumatobacteraceae bacterium]HRB10097.1 hypothetical protein [Ottowia sp.]